MSPKQCETTEAQRKVILNLYNQGISFAEIGELMDRSRFAIQTVVNRFKGETNFESSKRSARLRKLTERERAQVVEKIKLISRITSTQISADIKEDFGKNVHPKTVQRALHEAGYNSRVARRKPLTSFVNQKKRLDYAKQFLDKPLVHRDQVRFLRRE